MFCALLGQDGYYMLGGNLVSLLYGDVSVMLKRFGLVAANFSSPEWKAHT